MGTLVDSFGRVATDLRVSVTDRCNLRCTYCMPAEGLEWLPKPELLTFEELTRLIRIAVGLGITSVRLTGGEPLVRRGLPELVAQIAALNPRPRIAMTTNGLGLDRLARPLADAGLAPVKVNAVVMRGVNDTSVADLLAWCLERGYELRFIEQMPLDADHRWDRSSMVTQAEVLDRLSERFTLTPTGPAVRGSAPTETWLVDGGPARVGVIASVSQPFCGTCDRMRLTADGQLRNCLFARSESDLRGPMRAGASDAELGEQMQRLMMAKKAGHGIDDPSFLQPQRPMSAIGG